jgi:hypothetical protein
MLKAFMTTPGIQAFPPPFPTREVPRRNACRTFFSEVAHPDTRLISVFSRIKIHRVNITRKETGLT